MDTSRAELAGLCSPEHTPADCRRAVELAVSEDAGVRALRLTLRDQQCAQAHTALSAQCHILSREGTRCLVPIDEVHRLPDGVCVSGHTGEFTAVTTWRRRDVIRPRRPHVYYDATLAITYAGSSPLDIGVRVVLDVCGPGQPRFMIPAAFYKENRFPQNTRKYPRYDPLGGHPGELVSHYWSFRSDRASLPAVFAWNEALSAALCVDELSSLGLNGIGFSGNADAVKIWVDFPYREEPVVYNGEAAGQPADVQTYRIQPGEAITVKYRVYAADEDLHSYDPFVRTMYNLHQAEHPLHPWVGLSEAAELTAHGLYRWHYHPEHQALYETAAFDREFNHNVKGLGDRPHMHVAWVSGAPYAFALLTYGRQQARSDYVEAATRVLDKIASGLAPCGAFWAEWTSERGWGCGWNPNPKWLQARTIAEATLFMVRAIQFERRYGADHPSWAAAAESNLHFAVRVQRDDGNFGSYYHCESGAVEEWDGAGGLLWMAALVEGAAAFNNPRFAEAATRAGRYYERFVKDEYIYGAPEDVHLTPTSEDAYNAVVAYVLLYEQERDPRWLELAQRSADWMMTFRWTYNLTFPRHSLLAQYG
ncbi:MAG: hypothetical protein K6T83_19530, partial [Alicyclobacillus sp.]|nr:hypothetical protein [Alicyclobacillus sp.]